MTGDLQDKVAFITGSDSGIGQAIAIEFAKEGADAVVHYPSAAPVRRRDRSSIDRSVT